MSTVVPSFHEWCKSISLQSTIDKLTDYSHPNFVKYFAKSSTELIEEPLSQASLEKYLSNGDSQPIRRYIILYTMVNIVNLVTNEQTIEQFPLKHLDDLTIIFEIPTYISKMLGTIWLIENNYEVDFGKENTFESPNITANIQFYILRLLYQNQYFKEAFDLLRFYNFIPTSLEESKIVASIYSSGCSSIAGLDFIRSYSENKSEAVLIELINSLATGATLQPKHFIDFCHLPLKKEEIDHINYEKWSNVNMQRLFTTIYHPSRQFTEEH